MSEGVSQNAWGQSSPAPYDAVIVSDLHLGSDICQTQLLLRFLQGLPPTRRLVLNGDVLEGSEHRLSKKHWKVLSVLRRLSDGLEVVWVAGNHDHDAESVAHLIGARFVPIYRFISGDRVVECLHGDYFDGFLTSHPLLTAMADQLYLALQRCSPTLAMNAKRRSKMFLRCADRVCQLALGEFADLVVCGHTHHAEVRGRYANSGCWTEPEGSYLLVAGGVVTLHEFGKEGR